MLEGGLENFVLVLGNSVLSQNVMNVDLVKFSYLVWSFEENFLCV
jgi:hypothetical protein